MRARRSFPRPRTVEALRRLVVGGGPLEAFTIEDGLTPADRIEAALQVYQVRPPSRDRRASRRP